VGIGRRRLCLILSASGEIPLVFLTTGKDEKKFQRKEVPGNLFHYLRVSRGR